MNILISKPNFSIGEQGFLLFEMNKSYCCPLAVDC